jgi:hypothetical protein
MTCCREDGLLQRDLLEVVLLIWHGAVVQRSVLILFSNRIKCLCPDISSYRQRTLVATSSSYTDLHNFHQPRLPQTLNHSI